MLGLRLWVNNDSGSLTVDFGSAGASPSQGDFAGTTEHQLGDDAEAHLLPGVYQPTEWLSDG